MCVRAIGMAMLKDVRVHGLLAGADGACQGGPRDACVQGAWWLRWVLFTEWLGCAMVLHPGLSVPVCVCKLSAW